MSKSKIVRGALSNIIDAADLFRKKPIPKEDPKVLRPVSDRELSKFMGASDEYLDAQETGVRFFEKPTYFEDIKDSISSSQLNDLEQVFGRKLNTYNINDILLNPEQPLSDLIKSSLKDEDNIKGSSFIVWNPEKQTRYLANTSGADSYIRMWTGIDYK